MTTPDKITPGKALEPVDIPISPKTPSGFESHMQGTAKQPMGSPASQAPSPMALEGKSHLNNSPTIGTLMNQAKVAQDSLGTVSQQLNTPNLKLKRSQSHLLKNKLSNANEHLQSAGDKLGVQAQETSSKSMFNPIDRFLGYISHGQNQLVAIQQKLKELSNAREDLRPGDMMYLQIKMSTAQQEIEYSSTLLGKVIESIRTVLNIQL